MLTNHSLPQQGRHALVKTSRFNPNHNIYSNNGSLWLHCTIHRADHTKHRIRISLRTRDYAKARRRRDFALRHISGVVGAPRIIHATFANELQVAA